MVGEPQATPAEEARSVLQCRLDLYRAIRLDYLTPLLDTELLYATKLYQEALQHPNPAILEQPHRLEHLDGIDDQLKKHWLDLNTSLGSRATLLALIKGYQMFLAKSILLDYRGVSEPVKGCEVFVSRVVDILNKYSSTGEQSEKDTRATYKRKIVRPMKEMMIDQGHAERRLRLSAEQQRPTSEVYRLINQRDWPSLATMLIEDRKLVVTLRDQEALSPHFNMRSTCEAALLEMDKIRRRYFRDLTSKHAQDGSPREAAELPRSPEESGTHSRLRRAASSAAKDICDTITGTFGRIKIPRGLKAPARSGFSKLSSPRSSMDEKALLLTSREE